MRVLLAALALILAVVREAAGQLPQGMVVGTTPDVPARGTVAWIRVTADSLPAGDTLTAVEGEVEGEPLHFEARRAGGYRALLPVPLEGGDTLPIRLTLHRETRSDTSQVLLIVARENYPRERLRVPPRMARPDSAAAARIDREVAQARAIGGASHGTPTLWVGPSGCRARAASPAASGQGGNSTGRSPAGIWAPISPDRSERRCAPRLAGWWRWWRDFYLAGHALYLDHGGGLVTGYFHLSRMVVAARRYRAAGAIGRRGRPERPGDGTPPPLDRALRGDHRGSDESVRAAVVEDE